jgi:hypothetical protein
VQQSAAIQQVA